MIKDLEIQCDILCVFFFPYKKIIPYISEVSRTFLTKAKMTLPRKSCWGNYCEYKYTCTFSLFLMKLIASRKTSVSFWIFLQASPVHKRPLYVNIPGELQWEFLASRNARREEGRGLGFMWQPYQRRKLEDAANPFSPKLWPQFRQIICFWRINSPSSPTPDQTI